MGLYVRKKLGRQRSISETLSEAEDEHYLDCPDADLITRCAAVLLDVILLVLVVTAVDRVSRALGVAFARRTPWEQLEATFRAISFFTKLMVFYLNNIWSVARWGGSGAKLLLGLRVVDRETGANLSLSQTLTREVLGKLVLGALTCGIGWLIASFRGDRLALQDLISGSVVKKVRSRL